ncbi:dehydrogenase [Cephaloticoccus primus]|uniref:Dehydrogenase n=1 Tax=Cephaloticoccus primus TaxID=1548207 RepID=A0A139SMW7_9BACT|nr:Gfo/Idh/MocA family oxidoreductase [Cephaloticoccus primus]KXU35943.1 dehydrogenase [Cephaloticoccus primus]
MKTAAAKKASDIKVGVVGYGGSFSMANRHLKSVALAGMTPLAVVEPDKERRAVAAQDFPGIETYASVGEMLKKSEVGLVILVTPHNTHAPLALQCLRAGRHVVSEKPLALTTKECDAMIVAAKKSGVMLSAFHNRHWDGSIMRALEVLKSGVIGDLVRVEARSGGWGMPSEAWRGSRSISGGLLYDWGVHFLEYILQLADSEIVEVSGYSSSGFWAKKSKWKADTIEDDARAVVRFKSGVHATLALSQIDAHLKPGMVEVTGTKGTFVWEYGTHKLIVKDGEKTTVTEAKNPPELWDKYYENVAAHLSKGEKLIITPEWARRPIHIIDLAIQSAKKGRTLPAKYK